MIPADSRRPVAPADPGAIRQRRDCHQKAHNEQHDTDENDQETNLARIAVLQFADSRIVRRMNPP